MKINLASAVEGSKIVFMGTRATLTFHGHGEPIATLYVQCDGYWSGFGCDVAKILASRPIRNGISGNGPMFNGPNDLAVQVITELKAEFPEPGHYYLHAPDCDKEFYHYEVHANFETISFVAFIDSEEKFRGKPADFTGKEPTDGE